MEVDGFLTVTCLLDKVSCFFDDWFSFSSGLRYFGKLRLLGLVVLSSEGVVFWAGAAKVYWVAVVQCLVGDVDVGC